MRTTAEIKIKYVRKLLIQHDTFIKGYFLVFPAGMLQPPFYHKHFPKALNFGGTGVVIGHEITHGFDDKGRLFDHHGNFHLWWKEASIEKFNEKAQCLINQYSKYVIPDIKIPIDGFLTQGENIADNGGLKQAFLVGNY